MSAPAAAPIVESDAVVTPTVAAVEAEVVAEPTEATAVEPAAAPAVAQPAPAAAQHEAKKFLLKHKEKLKMNQYWSVEKRDSRGSVTAAQPRATSG